jgi:hypothetical protein
MILYLSSYEYNDFASPRKILKHNKTVIDKKNVLIVDVDTPIIGQKYGLAGNDLIKLYLVNRVDESAFIKLEKFPIDVHILIPKSVENLEPSSMSQLQNIAWGCIYDNEIDARNHRILK